MVNLRKTITKVAMRGIERINKLKKMPINQFMIMVEDIIEADEEAERRREEIRRKTRGNR